MYKEDKSSKLAQRIADYLEDRSFGAIAVNPSEEDNDTIIATLDGVSFPVTALVYDKQSVSNFRDYCELALVVASPKLSVDDYAEHLNGYTLVDGIRYEGIMDDGSAIVKILLDDYNEQNMDEVASLAAVNFIPVMKFAVSES